MKSLTAKLTLAFLAVAVAGIALVALVIRGSTRAEFDQLVLSQNQQALVGALLSYFEQTGSWQGVEGLFEAYDSQDPGMHMPGMRWTSRQQLFALANQDGKIIFGGSNNDRGRSLRPKDLSEGIALKVDNKTVGTLVYLPSIDRWQSGTPEGDYFVSVSRAVAIGATAAVLLSLALGGILAQTLTRTLRELTSATQELAKGKLGRQVPVTSQDELGALAISFNRMSADLQQSTELRKQMTANIAHDLRSPLSVILGYTEALNDGILQPTPEIFGVMHTEAQHLNHLIEDLKTLSLADAGELPLNLQAVSVARLLQRVADAHQVQAANKRITLAVDAAQGLPELHLDMERMVQVLGNLMSNALRFTPEGGKIALSASQAGAQVLLRVQDSGPGIAPEDLALVFERTYRGDPARKHILGESGLGLAIARSLVEAQGGKITVENVPGGGAEFTIHFQIPKG